MSASRGYAGHACRRLIPVIRGDGVSGVSATVERRRGDGVVDVPAAYARQRDEQQHRLPNFAARGHGAGARGRFVAARRGDGVIGLSAAVARQRGYTLIEVVVAFALLGLALSLLLGSLGGASRQVKWAGDAGRAALHAQSLLEQAGVGEELQPGQRDGTFEDGRYRWTLAIAPYADPLLPAQPLQDPGAPRLLQLDLVVQWGEGSPKQRIDLHTLRLVAPSQGAGTVMGQ